MNDSNVDVDEVIANVVTLLPSILQKGFSTCKIRAILFLLEESKNTKAMETLLLAHVPVIIMLPDNHLNLIFSKLSPQAAVFNKLSDPITKLYLAGRIFKSSVTVCNV